MVDKRVSNDTGGVEVWEEFGTKSIDEIVHLGYQIRAFLAEFDERVVGRREEHVNQWGKRFGDVHTYFAESEGGVGDGGKHDTLDEDKELERYPFWNVSLDPVGVAPVGKDDDPPGI